MESNGHLGDYEVMNKWVSYASQPSTFRFRLNCIKEEVCAAVTEEIKGSPVQFVSDLRVHYSLNSQKTVRRQVTVRAEHAQSSYVFAKLDQAFQDKNEALLQADDLKKLTLDIAMNVMAAEVTDDEFISQDQSPQISGLIESLLRVQSTSTATFSDENVGVRVLG